MLLPMVLFGLLVLCLLPGRLPGFLLDALLALMLGLLFAFLASLPLKRLPPELRLALAASLLPGMLPT